MGICVWILSLLSLGVKRHHGLGVIVMYRYLWVFWVPRDTVYRVDVGMPWLLSLYMPVVLLLWGLRLVRHSSPGGLRTPCLMHVTPLSGAGVDPHVPGVVWLCYETMCRGVSRLPLRLCSIAFVVCGMCSFMHGNPMYAYLMYAAINPSVCLYRMLICSYICVYISQYVRMFIYIYMQYICLSGVTSIFI